MAATTSKLDMSLDDLIKTEASKKAASKASKPKATQAKRSMPAKQGTHDKKVTQVAVATKKNAAKKDGVKKTVAPSKNVSLKAMKTISKGSAPRTMPSSNAVPSKASKAAKGKAPQETTGGRAVNAPRKMKLGPVQMKMKAKAPARTSAPARRNAPITMNAPARVNNQARTKTPSTANGIPTKITTKREALHAMKVAKEIADKASAVLGHGRPGAGRAPKGVRSGNQRGDNHFQKQPAPNMFLMPFDPSALYPPQAPAQYHHRDRYPSSRQAPPPDLNGVTRRNAAPLRQYSAMRGDATRAEARSSREPYNYLQDDDRVPVDEEYRVEADQREPVYALNMHARTRRAVSSAYPRTAHGHE